MDNKWRHWIAKCLTTGRSDDYISTHLESKGYSRADYDLELMAAKEHPYIKGAIEVYTRDAGPSIPRTMAGDEQFYVEKALNNQQWLLHNFEKMARLEEDFGTIGRIKAPSFDDFVSQYISKNRPVIITDAMHDWVPKQKWSFEYFRETHSDAVVGIQDGRESDPHYEQNQRFLRTEVRFGDFLNRIDATESSNDFYMTAGNMGSHRQALHKLFEDAAEIDIRGEYFDFPAEGSLWIGPRGTVTPLHFDMINNFFCQIIGRKRVRLVPSWSLPWVYNEYHVYSEVDAANPDIGLYPEFEKATVFDFIVEPGEVLFIPLGWWHHLESLDPTVSITRKNLKVRLKESYGDGFIKESRLFTPGQAASQ